jgi:Putative Ig domain
VNNPGSQTGTVGRAVSLQMSASGGTPPYTWSATGLPAGLSINSASGLISGTPTTATSYTVTVTARDTANVMGTAQFNWTISASGGGGCSGQKLTNPGFESGSTGWTATSGVINTDGAHSRTGNGYAWLDGYGSTHTDTLSHASVSIPSGCSANLTYYLWISSQEGTSSAYDKLTLTVNGTTVQSFSNVNKGSSYVQRSVNLSSYAGQTITLKWTGAEDYSLATSLLHRRHRPEPELTPADAGAAACAAAPASCGYPDLSAPVAQGIERRTPKPGVAGSNPAGGTELPRDADDARSAVVDARISKVLGWRTSVDVAPAPRRRSTYQYCGRRADTTSWNRSWDERNLGPALADRRSPAHCGLAAGGDP